MANFWSATGVDVTNGGYFVTVNTGDDVGLIQTNSILQINTTQFVEVKDVNTSASPQTIELFEAWNAGTITGGTAIAAPSAAELSAAIGEVQNLISLYEDIASNTSEIATPSTIAQRDLSGRLEATAGSSANDVVVMSQTGTSLGSDITTSATDTTAGRLLKVGADEDQFSSATKATVEAARAGGIGIKSPTISAPNDIDETKFFSTAVSWTGSPLSGSNANNQGSCLHIENTNTAYATQLFTQAVGGGVYRIRRKLADVWQSWQELYHTGNTTVDGSGFIKQASPIVKLHSDRAEFNSQCPESAEFEKVDTGHYLIKNTLGFAQKGWYIENPKDANGNVKVYVDYEQLEDNTLEIKTYTPDYSTGKCMAGAAADIPDGRWIDLRLEVEPVNINETTEEI